MLGHRRWRAIGTWIEVVALERRVDEAAAIVSSLVDDLDRTCSRFRPDSELRQLPTGHEVSIGATLNAALAAALRTARATDGLVDPTVGRSLRTLGYDDDLDAVRERSAPAAAADREPAPGWWRIWHDAGTSRVLVPHGIELDLGAAAKAWAADRAAALCSHEIGGPILVNLGGDLAVAGRPPKGYWRIAVSDGRTEPAPVIEVRGGGVATSSTLLRTWAGVEGLRQHVVDPRTGGPAAASWAAVSTAARSCELANAATTAAIVLGAEAEAWLTARDVPARLVDEAGAVVLTGNWPADRRPAA